MNVSKTFQTKPSLFELFYTCFKMFPVKPQFLELVYKFQIVYRKCFLEHFKHYNVNVYLEMCSKTKDRV